ncbi:MAG TPA: electron transfer flavoprotein-ubiquinone oxidoreductase [Caulobacteraceae bacterium]
MAETTDGAPARESMNYDVVIVGGGPAGLAAAIRLKQLAVAKGSELSVALLEKGSEIGAHILSGAVIDPKGLNELIPDWKDKGAPLETPVARDRFVYLTQTSAIDISWLPMPGFMHNHGNYVGSLANLCRWLGGQAEALGVEVYPGMAASEPVYGEDGALQGVVAGVFGIGKDGSHKSDYQPGLNVMGKYVLLAEGARGSLSKLVQAKYGLCEGHEPQKYGLGVKELWQVPEAKFQAGLVQHSFGWPLDDKTGGGGFIYHFGDRYVAIGLVVHLNYANPWLSPFEEFQRFKQHPQVRPMLEGATRVSYGARAITEGGFQSVPALAFPGGALIGCAAGFVNLPRIKGSHNAIKSGMMAAEAAFEAVSAGRSGDALVAYQSAYEGSWVAGELKLVRNVKPLWSKFGTLLGIVLGGLDMWTNVIAGVSLFGTLKHGKTDAEATGLGKDHPKIAYPKPDGVISFDRLSSVFVSNTAHDEDQPCHLKLKDPSIPIEHNLPLYGEPARLYCPAAVYEVVYDAAGENPRFVINAANCVHCKTCDIKDPAQNIVWTTPEGGGGPNYPNM